MNLVSETGLYGRVMGWLVAAGLLAAALSFLPSLQSVFDPSPVTPVMALRKAPPLHVEDVPALEAYADIMARPLFNPERKPYVDAADNAGAGQAGVSALGDLSLYRLVGLVKAGDVQLALIRKTGGSQSTVKPGDNLDGWSVVRLGPEGVTLSGGGREQLLAIPKATNSAKSP